MIHTSNLGLGHYNSRQRSLSRLLSCLEILIFRAFDRRSVLKCCYIPNQLLPLLAKLPCTSKLIGSSRYRLLMAWLDDPFFWICHRGEEVCGCLTIRAVIAEISKIFFRLACWSKVDLSAFVQYRDFIEYLQTTV